MWRMVAGVLLGMLLMAWPVDAFRIVRPPNITVWNESTRSQLTTWLESLWQLVNGRYTVDVVTTNPNGSRDGTQGDLVLYNNNGSYKLCGNTSATTAASPTGKTWRCSPDAWTAP